MGKWLRGPFVASWLRGLGFSTFGAAFGNGENATFRVMAFEVTSLRGLGIGFMPVGVDFSPF